MKSITIKNSTGKAVVVEYNTLKYNLGVDEKLNIELTQSDTMRVYPRLAKSAHFAMGQFFMKGTLRNVWMYMFSYIVSLVSVFTIPKCEKWIDITARDYHHSTFIIFRSLCLNGKSPDKCEFLNQSDRRIAMILCSIVVFPVFIFCLCILLLSVYGLISDFAPEFIFSAVLSFVGVCVTVNMLKSARRFSDISDNTEKVLAENKRIVIIKESDRYIKYREYTE